MLPDGSTSSPGPASAGLFRAAPPPRVQALSGPALLLVLERALRGGAGAGPGRAPPGLGELAEALLIEAERRQDDELLAQIARRLIDAALGPLSALRPTA